MPGVTLQLTPSTDRPDVVTETLEELCYFDSYTAEIRRKDRSYTIGSTRYPSYPLREFETSEYWILLEGEIYSAPNSDPGDEPAIEDVVVDVAGRLFGDDEEGLREWLWETDGEFLVYAIEKSTNELAIVNDVFGRLPLYYTRLDSSPIVTREIGTLFEASDIDLSFDRYGIAQYLLFGYVLGDRTLWEDVRTLPPGTRVTLRPDGSASFASIAEFDFDRKEHADKSVAENAANLASLFVRSCRSRTADGRETVLSLSGGHDSRSIAAAFRAGSLPCSAATFRKATADGSSDASIARDIARELDFDWQLFDIEPVNSSNARTLLELKRGLNHVGLASLLDFFEQLGDAYGDDLVYFTGDGGDKALPDLSPAKSLSSRAELVSYAIERNSVFSLSEVATITGLERGEIAGSVAAVIDEYPESDLASKYVHFLTHERGFSWLFEGEDRNRYYFWSTSPFYSTPFFRYAMNVPDRQKKHNRLYREFLERLWPRATEFDDADFGTPMSSPRYELVQHALSFLGRHPSFEDVARLVYRGELTAEYHPNISRVIGDHVETTETFDRYFDADAVGELLDDRSSCGHHQIFNLLTLSSAIAMNERRDVFPDRGLRFE